MGNTYLNLKVANLNVFSDAEIGNLLQRITELEAENKQLRLENERLRQSKIIEKKELE